MEVELVARLAAVQGAKKKGRAGMAVQPKSREETPKVGTPWGLGPATALTFIWACSCCAATSPRVRPHDLREECGRRATQVCQMATLEL